MYPNPVVLNIKYMDSKRSIDIVRAELDRLNITHGAVDIGWVELEKALTSVQRKLFRIALSRFGFELLEKHKDKLIEKINKAIADIVDKPAKMLDVTNSTFISDKLDYNYTYLSNVFSEVTSTTIEHAIINLKIEKAKELMLYGSLSITQIAQKLHYSSVAHLCKQFKKVTGLTPTFFKNAKKKRLLEMTIS
mgnify:CR=1 FL=1